MNTPSGFWLDHETGRTRVATKQELRDANRLFAKHRDLAQRKGPRRNEGPNDANESLPAAVVMR